MSVENIRIACEKWSRIHRANAAKEKRVKRRNDYIARADTYDAIAGHIAGRFDLNQQAEAFLKGDEA